MNPDIVDAIVQSYKYPIKFDPATAMEIAGMEAIMRRLYGLGAITDLYTRRISFTRYSPLLEVLDPVWVEATGDTHNSIKVLVRTTDGFEVHVVRRLVGPKEVKRPYATTPLTEEQIVFFKEAGRPWISLTTPKASFSPDPADVSIEQYPTIKTT